MNTIFNVILWSNGNVIVFDEKGEQVPELQGRADRVYGKILMKIATQEGIDRKNIGFEFGVWRRGTVAITEEQFKTFSQAPFDQMECWNYPS